MLRYDRQTKPGLVALYDIRPGNGAGPFLQPRSPHGAAFCVGEHCSVSLGPQPAITMHFGKHKHEFLLHRCIGKIPRSH